MYTPRYMYTYHVSVSIVVKGPQKWVSGQSVLRYLGGSEFFWVTQVLVWALLGPQNGLNGF